MFNLAWDITYGKVEKKKDGLAESGLRVKWKKIMAVSYSGLSHKCINKNSTITTIGKREGDWSKTEGAMEEEIVLHFAFEFCFCQDSREVYPG